MRAGWEVRPLGDVCRLINGRAYKQAELLEAGPYPVLRVGNFFTNNHWYYSDLELDADKYCDDGDLLYAWSASFGPRIWQGGKVIYHYHIWKVAPDTQRLDRDYLYYFFDWDKELIKKEQGAGATMIHVSKGSMEARLISFPPLQEQQRIVAVLDEAFGGLTRARAHAEANLRNARELFELRRARIFSADAEGEAAYLEDVCLGFEYGTAAKSLPTGRVSVLRMGNLQDGEIDWTDLVYSDDTDDCTRYLLKPGDVLFNRTNSAAHVGKTAIFDGKMPAIFAGYLIRVTPDPKKLTPHFLNHFLNSDVAREYGRSVMGTSVNQANISGGRLKRYTIRVPSLSRQQELSDELDAIKEAIKPLQSNYRAQLHSIDALRQCLLQRAFAGELTGDAHV